jgi:rhodanese-related sulfurtransferase
LIVSAKWLCWSSSGPTTETVRGLSVIIKQAAKEVIVLVFAAVGIALIVNAVRPDKIRLSPVAVNPAATRQPAGEAGIAEVSLQEALYLYRKKGTIFADARHPTDFGAGHIKGAVNLYAADQDAWLPGFLSATDPDTVIVTYCDGESCHLARQLAELLYFNGFNHVRYLKNGWTRWHDRGLPVE